MSPSLFDLFNGKSLQETGFINPIDINARALINSRNTKTIPSTDSEYTKYPWQWQSRVTTRLNRRIKCQSGQSQIQPNITYSRHGVGNHVSQNTHHPYTRYYLVNRHLIAFWQSHRYKYRHSSNNSNSTSTLAEAVKFIWRETGDISGEKEGVVTNHAKTRMEPRTLISSEVHPSVSPLYQLAGQLEYQ